MANRILQIVLVVVVLLLAVGIPAASLVVNAPDEEDPQWRQRIYAESRGYDWLTCPICGTEFGTHQIEQSPEFISPSANGGLGPVTPECSAAIASLRADGEEVTPEAILARKAELASESEQSN